MINKYIIPSKSTVTFRGISKEVKYKNAFGIEYISTVLNNDVVEIDKELIFTELDLHNIRTFPVEVYGGGQWFNENTNEWIDVPEYCSYPKEQDIYYDFKLSDSVYLFLTVNKKYLKIE